MHCTCMIDTTSCMMCAHLWVCDAAAKQHVIHCNHTARPHEPQQHLIVPVSGALIRICAGECPWLLVSVQVLMLMLWLSRAHSTLSATPDAVSSDDALPICVLTYEGKVIKVGLPSIQQLLQGVFTLPQPRLDLQHDTYKDDRVSKREICGIPVRQPRG